MKFLIENLSATRTFSNLTRHNLKRMFWQKGFQRIGTFYNKSQRGGADYFKQPETQTWEDINRNPIPVNQSYIKAKSWLQT